MEVKKITEGMTAPQVAQVIDDNFKAQNKILEEDIAKQNNVIGVSEYKDFSEAEAVNVGDVRKYNGFLYECVEATTGAFDASKWKKSSFKAETEKKISDIEEKTDAKLAELGSIVYENKAIWKGGEIYSKYFYDETGKLVDISSTGNASEWGASSYDVSELVGKQIFVATYCDASAYNLFIDSNGEILEKWQQNGMIKEIIIPYNASKILLSNSFTAFKTPFLNVAGISEIDVVKTELNNKTILGNSVKYIGQYSYDNPSGNDDNSLLKDVIVQGNGKINTRRFQTLNDKGNIELIENQYTPNIVLGSLIEGNVWNYYFEYIRKNNSLPISPWTLSYRSGSTVNLWVNYNIYSSLRTHFSFKNMDGTTEYTAVEFTPGDIYVGSLKTKDDEYSLVETRILSVVGNYCQISTKCLQKADKNAEVSLLVFDYNSGNGNKVGEIYQFFGFEELINKQCAVPLDVLSNILPEKSNYNYTEAIVPGFVSLLKNAVIGPTISEGYSNNLIENPIPDVQIDKFNKTAKLSAGVSTIFPFLYSAFNSEGAFGIWLNKTEYEGILRLQISLVTSPVEFTFVDIYQSDFILGASFSANSANIAFTATILAVNGDFYFFEVNYKTAVNAEVHLIPYEKNSMTGAIVGKNYTHVGWLGTSNPYNHTLKYNLSRLLRKDESSQIKLALPDKIVFEYNKATQIFKHCITTAFNYKNYNIQVLLDRDAENGKDYNRYFMYQPKVTGEVNATFQLFDNGHNLLDEKEVKFNVIQKTEQPSELKTVLFIGDSLTYYNRITDEFYRVLTSSDSITTVKDTLSVYDVVKLPGRSWGNIQLIGTQKNDYKGWTGQTFHEGYSGWEWSNFITSGSPFFINGTLDFNAYLYNNGFSTPDVIYIGLGWNDQKKVTQTTDGKFDVSVVMRNARTFLQALTEQLPNTKVRLWTENVPGVRGGIGNHPYGSGEWADEHRAKLIQIAIAEGYKELIKEFPNVGLVWSTAMIDSENSLQETTSQINIRIKDTEILGYDYVHPADSGFFLIADSLISDFVGLNPL